MAIVRSLRRFQSRFFSSSPSSSQVTTEISNLISGSNIEQPGRSSTVPFTSERPIRRKVSTADRKAMLKSFVNKYREMNMGKFPCTTYARKEVGGGYYVIKKMLQEIEYDFRTSSVEKELIKDHKKQTEGENTTSVETSTESSGSQEVSNSQITIVQQPCKDFWTVNSFDNYELKDVVQPSTSSANSEGSNIKGSHVFVNEDHHGVVQCYEKLEQKPKDDSPLEDKSVYEDSQSKVEEKQPDGIKNIVTENCDTEGQCHGKVEQKPEDKLIDESVLEENFVSEDLPSKTEVHHDGNCDTEGQCHGKVEQKPEDKLIDESVLEEKFVSEDLQSKIEVHHDGIRNINRGMPEQQKDDDLREKPSLWGSLKLLATDIIKLLKK